MQHVCAHEWCRGRFEITDDDLAFYEKVSPTFNGKKYLLPPPTLCPECREQRKICWNNETNIHRNQCAHCKKNIIAEHTIASGLTVLCTGCFWSDSFDPTQYGQDIDWSQPFMQQVHALIRRTPHIALMNMQAENSDHCHRIFDGRNNYLSFIALYEPEDLMYTYYTVSCKSCMDISLSQYSELCYQSIDLEHCYHCFFSRRARNCRDCYFVEDCVGCHNCFACKNLNHQSYCWFNEPLGEREYTLRIEQLKLQSHGSIARAREASSQFFLTLPHRHAVIVNGESVLGDFVFNCKECSHVFNVYESEFMKYCINAERCSHCMDCHGMGVATFCYDSTNLQVANSSLFSSTVLSADNVIYCISASAATSHCFGCVSMKKNKYCILNRQYTKEEYERCVQRIIEKMRSDHEWGQFFPPSMSLFGYNETVAQEHYPLTKEQALARGFHWSDYESPPPRVEKVINANDLTDTIDGIPDDILNWAIVCEATKKPFRIIKPELEFYRRMHLPIPHIHPDERHRRRIAQRNPCKLWNRQCTKCQKPIATSYSPDSPEIVYCEECYRKEVY